MKDENPEPPSQDEINATYDAIAAAMEDIIDQETAEIKGRVEGLQDVADLADIIAPGWRDMYESARNDALTLAWKIYNAGFRKADR